MTRSRLLLPAALLILATIPATADVRVREMRTQSLSSSDETTSHDRRPGPGVTAAPGGMAAPSAMMSVYPVAGTVGRDVIVPYFVDLDTAATKLDWNCGDLTFNGHSGHDPYVRSFAEQRIGVPVFAARDGVVSDVRDGEPDENTNNDPGSRANYVTIQHGDDELTQYVHLRKGIPVAVGDTVTAGTQIGWVGSSGMSMGPHLHFEARVGGTAYEPMAGPCRPGLSYFSSQPARFDEPIVFGATFSDRSFGNVAPPPHDDAPHVSTFVKGSQTIWFKVETANVGASTRYRLRLERPGSTRTELAATGVLTSIDTSLASIWWGLDVDLDRAGTWAMILEMNGRRVFSLPFTVVDSRAEVVNRAPNAISATLEPLPLRLNEVAVCRATGFELADPDYDVVRYRYEWRVNGAVARDVTTAAQSDALPRQFMTNGADVSCSITASDGRAAAPTVTTHGSPAPKGRRRSLRR